MLAGKENKYYPKELLEPLYTANLNDEERKKYHLKKDKIAEAQNQALEVHEKMMEKKKKLYWRVYLHYRNAREWMKMLWLRMRYRF